MKITRLFFSALTAAVTLSAAAVMPHAVQSWRVTAPVNVRIPFMNDTIAPDGKPFSKSLILKSHLRGNVKEGNIAVADTLGSIALELTPGQSSLRMYQTRLRASRFAKGNLKITSQLPFVVEKDGEQVMLKESVERDSVAPQSTAKTSFRLEPERDVLISVKLLDMASDSVSSASFTAVFEPDEKFADVEFRSGADLLRRFTLDDSEFGNKVTGLSMSPDGRYLITRYSYYYSRTRSRAFATLTDLKTGMVINANLNQSVRWMPRGNELFYTVPAASGFDLIKVNPATGAETLALTSIPTDQITWSPNEDYFIYSHYEEGVRESGPLRRYASPDDRQPGNRHRWFLMKYDVASGLSERLTFGNHTTSLADIAPDGKSIICITNRENPTRRPFYENTIYILDIETLKADTLVASGPSFVNSASFSPDGRQILFSGSPAAFDGIGNNSGAHPIPNDYDIQLFLMTLADRKVRPLTRDFNPSVGRIAGWNQKNGQIYFIAADGFYNRIYSLAPSTGIIECLPIEIDNVQGVAMGDEADTFLAYFGQGYEYAGRAFVYNIRKHTNSLLADPRAEQMAELNLGKVEPWTFTAADSTVIDGVICYPPDFDPNKKYPLIVYYYGGTTPTVRGITQPYTPQLFASRDYVVYVINPSGTIGYGQEFSARHVNAWGRQTADDIISGVKAFVNAHPFVNAEKIGCLGASYGGFMTQYLQTQTDIFAAAVSHAGISDVTSYWGEGYWGYSYNSVAAADSYPWSNPDLFTKQGSLFNADKIHTPLLLLHGTADTNVPIGESIQLFNALRILNRPVEFISVDGENHFISDYPKRILWQNSIMAWFARWLQDDPSWWDDIYPERHL